MLRMGKKLDEAPEEVIAKATTYFGPGGVGLDVLPRGPRSVEFRGGGGFVLIQAAPLDEGTKTEIDVQSREWEHDVKKFMGSL